MRDRDRVRMSCLPLFPELHRPAETGAEKSLNFISCVMKDLMEEIQQLRVIPESSASAYRKHLGILTGQVNETLLSRDDSENLIGQQPITQKAVNAFVYGLTQLAIIVSPFHEPVLQ